MSAKQEVAPKEIEAKLTEIWDELQGTNKMRACLFNLVIFTKKNDRIDYIETIAQKLIEKFPSRIIFVTLDENATGETLKTSVSVMGAKSGDNEIVCDLITIEASPKSRRIVPFVAIPHLLPDLPVYLHWAEDTCLDDPIAEALGQYATRIIYDSECCDHLGRFAKSVLQRKENLGNNLADLNWRRIEGWRHLLSDSCTREEYQEILHAIESIDITYNAKTDASYTHTKAQALYLQAWIASQLGWSIEKTSMDGDKTVIHYKEGIKVTLTPDTMEGIGPGRIMSIILGAKGDKKMVCERTKDKTSVRVEVSTPDFCDVPSYFLLDGYAVGMALSKEISHKGTSKHLFELLTLIANCDDEALKT